MSTKYNGWTNYETWLLKLWIDNEEASHNYWNEAAKACATAAYPRAELANQLKSHFEEAQHELVGVTGFWADMMGAAVASVNWSEVAEHMLEDVEEVTA